MASLDVLAFAGYATEGARLQEPTRTAYIASVPSFRTAERESTNRR